MIPLTTDKTTVKLDKILTKMLAVMRHSTETLTIGEKTRSVWETARLSFDGDFEMMMNHTDYNLRAANILLMRKRLSLPFT